MKSFPLILALSVLAGPAFASTDDVGIVFPSSDNRVLDNDGNGRGDVSLGEDAEKDTLNIGDNLNNDEWRSIVKFDLRGEEAKIRSASRVTLQFTVKSRSVKVPREWRLEIVQIKSGVLTLIDIDRSGVSDDFSSPGTPLWGEASGGIKSGSLIKVVVTDAIKAALESELFAVRLQLQPGTNKDNLEDQIAVFSGSHEVNTEHLRPQLQIER